MWKAVKKKNKNFKNPETHGPVREIHTCRMVKKKKTKLHQGDKVHLLKTPVDFYVRPA